MVNYPLGLCLIQEYIPKANWIGLKMSLTQQKKLELINIFLEAAIAYELGGNWQGVFKHYSRIRIGSIHRSCKRWCTETNEHFENAIKLYMGEV